MSGGGFIIDDSSTAGPSNLQYGGNTQDGPSAAPLLSLTPRQEGKLRAHLDDRLLSLERDDRKGTLGPIPSLIARLTPILHLILQIPPISPWSSLRIAYFLSFTGSITSYISSLPLYSTLIYRPDAPSRTGTNGMADITSPEASASSSMRQVLDFLAEVERGWRAVLSGEGWVMDTGDSKGRSVVVRFSASLDATERIRLRSIVLAGRERITAWARTYGSFPGSRWGAASDNGEVESAGPEWEWQHEVLGMWNGILELLSSDLEGANGIGSTDDEDI